MDNAIYTYRKEYRYERGGSDDYVPDWAVIDEDEPCDESE